jgi:hypothetical protein
MGDGLVNRKGPLRGQAMVTIQSKFIGDFKVGDNINHNLATLELLYRHYGNADERERRLLCKPIILLLVSIVEAVLHDLHTRIKTFTIEGVQNLATSAADYIRLKQIDEFQKYIASAKKHNLFDQVDSAFYEQMDELRRLRNRIHIQNTKNDFERNEYDAFNDDRKVLAKRVLEKTMRTMAKNFSRDHDHVEEFKLPWDAHFPDQKLTLKKSRFASVTKRK